MKYTLTFLTTLLVILPSTLPAVAEATPKPNISFVLFDDLGYGEPKGFRATELAIQTYLQIRTI